MNRVPPPIDLIATDEGFLDEFSMRPSHVINRNSSAAALPYDFYLVGEDLSYFTGKLECYLRYKELNFCRVEATLTQFQNIADRFTGKPFQSAVLCYLTTSVGPTVAPKESSPT